MEYEAVYEEGGGGSRLGEERHDYRNENGAGNSNIVDEGNEHILWEEGEE